MNYLDEFREPAAAKTIAAAIKVITTRPWNIMEVCGGQTHSIIKYGIDQLLPDEINLIHGPGCPVCVTPLAYIDKALAIAVHRRAGAVLASRRVRRLLEDRGTGRRATPVARCRGRARPGWRRRRSDRGRGARQRRRDGGRCGLGLVGRHHHSR